MKNPVRSCLLFFLIFNSQLSKAQYVPIPDTNFVNWLNTHGFASCLSGNNLDTTCPAVVNATSVNCYYKGIVNLEGIEYFDNLNYLNCGGNKIVALPDLQTTIDTLMCGGNKLASLPFLPPSLILLDCSYNLLTAMPSIPATLINLNCSHNILTALPALPPALLKLYCYANQITSLPVSLPATLLDFNCGNNSISTLPPLPAGLLTLDCYTNQIPVLPALPSSLVNLNCSSNPLYNLPPILPAGMHRLACIGNFLSSLPALPPNLTNLDCGYNQLTALPSIPATVAFFSCNNNQLGSIPPLGYLSMIDCSYNYLTSFPSFAGIGWMAINYNFDNNNITYLPNLTGVERLYCNNNQISSVDNSGHFNELYCSNNNITSFSIANLQYIRQLDCSSNQLTSLPASGSYQITINCSNNLIATIGAMPGCISLNCSNNQLTSIAVVNHKMDILNVSNNPALTCLPKTDTINSLSWNNTAIACLPGAIRITSAWPSVAPLKLCQPASGCNYAWNIYGNVFNDLNSDSIINPGESGLWNIPVRLDSAGVLKQIFYSNLQGYYSFETGVGTYRVQIDTAGLPYNVVWPDTGFYDAVLTPADSLEQDKNFGLICKPGYLDLASISMATSAALRPAAVRTLYVHAGDAAKYYGISCAGGVSGTVKVILDGPVSYLSPAAGAMYPSSVNGDTITWNISNFAVPDPDVSFNIIIMVDSTASGTDTLRADLQVSIAPGESNTANNFLLMCFPVVNSYDPNMKEAYPAGVASGDEITYTIHFQNTGNAPAENIYILDTLDNSLDETTLTFLSSSHPSTTQLLPNRVVRFSFPSINLPDSTSNEPESHGYTQFKIKRKASSTPNLAILNTAYIFFDLNPPVKTNMAGSIYNFDCNLLNEIVLSDSVICSGGIINASNGVAFPFPLQYSWKLDSLVIGTDSTLKLSNLIAGHHMLWLTISYEGCSITRSRIILAYFIPPVPVIAVNGDTLSAPFAIDYQWYLNGNVINGANQGSLHILQSGYYAVMLTNGFGCTAVSDSVYACVGLDSWILSDTAACAYDSIIAGSTASSALPVYYQWSIDSVLADSSSSIVIAGLAPGQHALSLIVSSGSSTATLNQVIYIYAVPPKPVITGNGDTLSTIASTAYQWYLDSLAVPGANQQTYVAAQSGLYTVLISDANGCNNISDPFYLVGAGIYENDFPGFILYPNPSQGNIFIKAGPEFLYDDMEIINSLGVVCWNGKLQSSPQKINLESLVSGIYLLRLKTDKNYPVRKFIIK